MRKILFVVSTLESSGPTNQLYQLISHLDRSIWQPHILTLSPEPSKSRLADFEQLGLSVSSLSLSRIAGLVVGGSRLRRFLNKFQPEIVHSQGIRPDSLLSALEFECPWVATSRNYPPEDYPTKFGALKGSLMARKHLSVLARCNHLVACSRSIRARLSDLGIAAEPIQNGVGCLSGDISGAPLMKELSHPIFISVGSLIPRKNMGLLVSAFEMLPADKKGSLVILGDGPEMQWLQEHSGKNVHLVGSVENVADYLAGADIFVSSSLSEGLPNTVLEALSVGLPAVLSDIESHKEISAEAPSATQIFALGGGKAALADAMLSATEVFDKSSVCAAREAATGVFSAEAMSARYQEFYLSILEGK